MTSREILSMWIPSIKRDSSMVCRTIKAGWSGLPSMASKPTGFFLLVRGMLFFWANSRSIKLPPDPESMKATAGMQKVPVLRETGIRILLGDSLGACVS
ncbi:hypothetical protein FKM82_022689 [Ascaphus truei]